jgi:hypothetical protein
MNKRLPGISLVLFATLILLAHDAIPHHHQPHQVCLVTSHCHSGEDDSHSHESEVPSHEHDGANGDGPCTLKQVIAVPPNQLRFDYLVGDFPGFNDTGFAIFYAVTNDSFCNFIAPDHIFLLPFHHFSDLTPYCINSCGLRAPPAV